jgi:hypothetical protein
MAILSTAARKKMPSKSFALPGKGEGAGGKGAGSYPIPDRAHARAALSRGAQHASPEQLKTIKAKVHAKFPGIGKRQEGGPTGASEWTPEQEAQRRATLDQMRDFGMKVTSGTMGPGLARILGRRDDRGRTGDYSRYDESAYPGMRKGGRITESKEHHAKEKRLLGELSRMEKHEKVEKRQFGGPVGGKPPYAAMMATKKRKNPMASSIGSRGLRDSGPSYPKQAASYVR